MAYKSHLTILYECVRMFKLQNNSCYWIRYNDDPE